MNVVISDTRTGSEELNKCTYYVKKINIEIRVLNAYNVEIFSVSSIIVTRSDLRYQK